jgi:hypothetical protein
MEYNYKKRGYLLPEGCKDLIDVFKPKVPVVHPSVLAAIWHEQKLLPAPAPLPAIIGEMTVKERMTVRELAEALKQRPFKIVADLMQLGVMATLNQPVHFEIIERVIRLYGFTAKKAV